jgi:hypothetical protein
MEMAVFWNVVPCSLVEIDRRFRDACCLHHLPDDRWSIFTRLHGATFQKTVIFNHVPIKFRKANALPDETTTTTNSAVAYTTSKNSDINNNLLHHIRIIYS